MGITVAVGIASQRCSSLHRLPCWHLSGFLSFMSVTVHLGALTLTLQPLYFPFPIPNCSCNFCDPFPLERPHHGPVMMVPVARLNYFCYWLCCSMPYTFVWLNGYPSDIKWAWYISLFIIMYWLYIGLLQFFIMCQQCSGHYAEQTQPWSLPWKEYNLSSQYFMGNLWLRDALLILHIYRGIFSRYFFVHSMERTCFYQFTIDGVIPIFLFRICPFKKI